LVSLIPRRTIGYRLIILFVENIEPNVPAGVQEPHWATPGSDRVDGIEELNRQSFQLQILPHVFFLE
jgi:hypothetical protein